MKKSYYAIIPANVRYDKELTPNAKLLYGEITALCNEKGFCWAGDSYFTELYGVSRATVQRWFKQLETKGYIEREVVYKEGTKSIDKRYTYLTSTYTQKQDNPMLKNETTPMLKNETVNITSINNTKEYIYTLFHFWNKKEIIKHRKMNKTMESHMNARLQEYSFEELKKAIDNYSTILKSNEFYWSHKWSLQDFMKPNNVTRFVDDADPLNNYRSKNGKRKRKLIERIDF